METQTILFLAAGYEPSFQIDRTDLVENTHRLQRWSQPFEDQIKYVMLIDIVFQLWWEHTVNFLHLRVYYAIENHYLFFFFNLPKKSCAHTAVHMCNKSTI